MNDFEAQIQEEIRRILGIISERMGLPSHWSGRVELVPNASFRGRKPFSCDILIEETLAHQDIRWSTLLHEALHAVSAGYLPTDYRTFRGWEEGVVEQLQRMFRPIVLAQLDAGVDETLFYPIDAEHQYNSYIEALERLRLLLNTPKEEFYPELLRTPIKERPGYIFGRGNSLPGQERIHFITVYSAANAALKGIL